MCDVERGSKNLPNHTEEKLLLSSPSSSENFESFHSDEEELFFIMRFYALLGADNLLRDVLLLMHFFFSGTPWTPFRGFARGVGIRRRLYVPVEGMHFFQRVPGTMLLT